MTCVIDSPQYNKAQHSMPVHKGKGCLQHSRKAGLLPARRQDSRAHLGMPVHKDQGCLKQGAKVGWCEQLAILTCHPQGLIASLRGLWVQRSHVDQSTHRLPAPSTPASQTTSCKLKACLVEVIQMHCYGTALSTHSLPIRSTSTLRG